MNVRRAVAAAIDRRELAAAAGQAVGVPGRTVGSVVLVPGQRGYRDVAAQELKPGPDEARALLLLVRSPRSASATLWPSAPGASGCSQPSPTEASGSGT